MIEFQNKTFKTRELNLPEFGEVLISTTLLNNTLLNNGGAFVSDEALYIDEKIFYFVDENEIELPKNELEALIISQVK